MNDGRWCFQVVDLCERWEMAKLEYQHGPTLHFLVRCLTMANLDTSIMTHLEDALMATRMGEIQRLAQQQCACCRRVTVCHLLGVAVLTTGGSALQCALGFVFVAFHSGIALTCLQAIQSDTNLV